MSTPSPREHGKQKSSRSRAATLGGGGAGTEVEKLLLELDFRWTKYMRRERLKSEGAVIA